MKFLLSTMPDKVKGPVFWENRVEGHKTDQRWTICTYLYLR